MSMAVVLQRVRDHLRSALALSADQCGVRVGGHPPASSGELYVAVDELGVECTARDHLREVYVVEVALWRRVGQWPDDRAGDALLRDDAYLAGALTLDRLERSVIAALHGNYTDIPAAANAAIGAGSPGGGDVFQLALYYAGRTRTEAWQDRRQSGSPTAWLGRRLKFAGMNRVQAMDVMQ